MLPKIFPFLYSSYEAFIANEWIELKDGHHPKGGVHILLTHLSHVEHFEEATEIISNGCQFKATSKMGRKMGSFAIEPASGNKDTKRKISETFQERLQVLIDTNALSWCGVSSKGDIDAVIKPVDDSSPLICEGYFSWWEVNNESCPTTITDIPKVQYLSELFNNSSRNGTVKFTVDINSLLDSYRAHFKPGGTLLFKKAGTLGYKHETCYTVIICVQEEGGADPLPQFTNIDYHSGLIDSGGTTSDGAIGITATKQDSSVVTTNTGLEEITAGATPTLYCSSQGYSLETSSDIAKGIPYSSSSTPLGGSLYISNPCSMIDGKAVRWNHYEFAFYFPQEHSTFTVNPSQIHLSFVQHRIYRKRGSRPVPVPWCTKYYKCSDYHMNKKTQKTKQEELILLLKEKVEAEMSREEKTQ